VEVRDAFNTTCAASPPLAFSTALLPSECPAGDCWQAAQWLSAANDASSDVCASYGRRPAPLLRWQLALPAKPLALAWLHVVGLGWYQAFLDGKRVGSQELDTLFSVYNETLYYTTHNLTAFLTGGEGAAHTLGVVLGRGWFNSVKMLLFGRFDLYHTLTSGPERLRALLYLRFADGTESVLPSIAGDPAWSCSTSASPIVQNSVFFGEVVEPAQAAAVERAFGPPAADGSGALPGWQACLLSDDTQVTREGLNATLPTPRAKDVEPVVLTEAMPPPTILLEQDGLLVLDFHQEFVGWVEIDLLAPAGSHGPKDEVLLIYGEALDSSGHVDSTSLYPGGMGR
jgi:alpha-L-rhamnosidase